MRDKTEEAMTGENERRNEVVAAARAALAAMNRMQCADTADEFEALGELADASRELEAALDDLDAEMRFAAFVRRKTKRAAA